jgi:hypothetical protein
MLRGLDFFLLPSFLKDLLQIGGYETMLAERDAWFQSPNCFIRGGADCLSNLKTQQQIGMDILSLIGTASDNKYDDYLPGEVPQTAVSDGQTRLGLTRRHIGSDQAKRAAGVFGYPDAAAEIPAAPLGGHPAQTRACTSTATGAERPLFAASAVDPDLSDTDNEEHQQKRRRTSHGRKRRRHLVSPTTARNRILQSQDTLLNFPGPAAEHVKIEHSMTIEGTDEHMHGLPPNIDRSKLGLRLQPNKLDIKPWEHPVPLNRASKFRVDSQHLAALMGVGATPPSSP